MMDNNLFLLLNLLTRAKICFFRENCFCRGDFFLIKKELCIQIGLHSRRSIVFEVRSALLCVHHKQAVKNIFCYLSE